MFEHKNVNGWLPALVIFCAGVYAILTQVLLLRELLVAFYGNELTLGAMLCVWLVLIGIGSLVYQLVSQRFQLLHTRNLLGLALWLTALALPVQIWLIRDLRLLLHVPYGEYVSFLGMLGGTALALLPSGICLGLIFPAVCHWAALHSNKRGVHAEHELSSSVGLFYGLDSLGSLLGGVLFTFLLAPHLSPFVTMLLAMAVALLASWLAFAGRISRGLVFAIMLALAIFAAWPGAFARLEQYVQTVRWRAFGVLSTMKEQEPGAPHVVASLDSRYQNLALLEAYGQNSLYGNGVVLGVFPDPIGGEHKIHFIMAQNPEARRVLLIGGNPVNDIPELLKYPLQSLVHVELDGALTDLLRTVGDTRYQQALRDVRLVQAVSDGPCYVKHSEESFDVIIVDAPEPTTLALNRFYTIDFYRSVQQRLTPQGFMVTGVEASDDLLEEAAALTASTWQSLRAVFPQVLVTSGPRNLYFAGGSLAALTFDRQDLYQRSVSAGLQYEYFLPEYFLDADEIDADKTAFVAARLADLNYPVNTVLRPMAAYYQMQLWSRFSGSRLEYLFAQLEQWSARKVIFAILAIGGILLLGSLGWQRHAVRQSGRHWEKGWTRSLLFFVLATTGCCAMALELILIYIFQSMLGYVYERIGLIVAIFMLGLTLGALWAAAGVWSRKKTWRLLVGLELILLTLAGVLPSLIQLVLRINIGSGMELLVELGIYGLMFVTGMAVGGQFSVAARLLEDLGLSRGAVAAQANAADLFGAAFGGFVVGVLLLPLWGITSTCWLLVAIKIISVFVIGKKAVDTRSL